MKLFAATRTQLRERTQTLFQQEQIGGKPLEFFQCHRIGRIVTTRESVFSNQLPMRTRTLRICAVAARVVYSLVSTPNFKREIHRGFLNTE